MISTSVHKCCPKPLTELILRQQYQFNLPDVTVESLFAKLPFLNFVFWDLFCLTDNKPSVFCILPLLYGLTPAL